MAKSDEKTTLRKGPWSSEEDHKLIAYVTRYGIWNWTAMAKAAGLQRSGKSCRLRWMNYLRPGIKRGNFTREEEETILDLHERLGNRWSVIASRLPGRTDNEIKNYWHTRLSKRLRHNLVLKSGPFQIPNVETEQESSPEIALPPAIAIKESNVETSGAIQLPLSSSNPAMKIDESQTNCSFKAYGGLQSIFEQTFTADGSYIVENSKAIYSVPGVSTATSQLARFQYLGNSCTDVWHKFLTNEIIYGG
ncbi:hypothetical protein ES288_A06G157000v1 [Gossypium darwinii]|uniref:Uncharacterized protein n=1 Tax=Gossypium darwinii TaxID=34276 RepID=A0A5D2G6D4_GOSDA|nr:hypothetical protein ES288_A06G157000v1 [Gossypium darwinii]